MATSGIVRLYTTREDLQSADAFPPLSLGVELSFLNALPSSFKNVM